MKFDIKQAFTYYLKDNNLVKKIVILYCILVLSYIFPLDFSSLMGENPQKSFASSFALVAGIILYLFLIGYYYSNINKRIYKQDGILVEFSNWKNIFLVGFKNILAFIILSVAIVLLIRECSVSIDDTTSLVFYILFLSTPFDISFTTDLRLVSYFDFKKIKHIFINNFSSFIKFVGWRAILGIAFFVLFEFCDITIINILFKPFSMICYFLMMCDLRAQFIRHAFKIQDKCLENSNEGEVNGY